VNANLEKAAANGACEHAINVIVIAVSTGASPANVACRRILEHCGEKTLFSAGYSDCCVIAVGLVEWWNMMGGRV
jgi:hypothetical protein